MLESEQKRFSFWDALLLASAGEAGCEAVISEDMRPGAMFGGVRIIPAFDKAGGISPEADALLA
jgi:predicted nucleic acid-binding protein